MGREKKNPPSVVIREYEASPEWKKKSRDILNNKECVCAICGRARWKKYIKKKGWKRVLRFSVHHVTYKNIPNEKEGDLVVLCWQCHDISHLILRLEHISTFYAELAKVVHRYFKYDRPVRGKADEAT